MRLDRIGNGTAGAMFAGGLLLSIAGALLTPPDKQLGRWVELVVWHGMLKWACILIIFGMGLLALGYLVTKRKALYEWAQAMQLATLPAWIFAVAIGATAARLVWNSFNWMEHRMVMSVVYIMVASLALIVGLFFDKPRLTAVLTVITSLTMAVGLSWVLFVPDPEAVHPASAVMGSQDVAYKIFAAMMVIGCLVWVLSLVVPTRKWLAAQAEDAEAVDEAAVSKASA